MCHMIHPLESLRSCPTLLCIIDLPLLKPRNHELSPTRIILTSISMSRPRCCDQGIQVCSFCSEKHSSSEPIWVDYVRGQSSAYLIDRVGNELCKCTPFSNCNVQVTFCLQSKKARNLCQQFIFSDSTPCKILTTKKYSVKNVSQKHTDTQGFISNLIEQAGMLMIAVGRWWSTTINLAARHNINLPHKG